MEPGTHKASAAVARDLVAVSLPKFCGYFLRLGATGFGGPIALAGYMQRDLVERRRWVTREDYLEGLALAQLAPGLLAAQLAIYLGYLRAGILGASLVGLAFIGPSFLMVLAIASAYVRYGGLSWMQPAFYGIGAGVVAIIARSAWKLARMVLHKDRLLWSIFLVLAVSTGITGREVIWLFLLGGVVAYIAKAAPRLRRPHAGIYVPLFAGVWLRTAKCLSCYSSSSKLELSYSGAALRSFRFSTEESSNSTTGSPTASFLTR
jgi:chromate transporter